MRRKGDTGSVNLWWGAAQRSRGAVVGIDAGNVDARVVIARAESDVAESAATDAVPVLGVGAAPAQGLSRGNILDARRLGEAIRMAVAQAERAAGHRVLGAYFSVPLSHCQPSPHGQRSGRIVLSSPAAVREVSMHAGERAAPWHAIADHAGLTVVGIVPSVLAASAAVVLPQEHEHSVIVVECGAEHTSVAAFSGGTVALLGAVPVGGDHITRDLASILGIDPMEAERLKFEVGNARAGAAVETIVRGRHGERTAVSVALIAAIISARVDQILAHVNELVRPVSMTALSHSGGGPRTGGVGQVILCGGGAALSGLAPIVRSALGMPVRIAGAWGFAGPASVQSPAYAAVLGLLRWRAIVHPHAEKDLAPFPTNRADIAGQPMRIGQTRWQAWLREFLP